MKNVYYSLLLALVIFFPACKSEETPEFIPRAPELIRSEIETFLQSYDWQNLKSRQFPLISADKSELKRLRIAWNSNGAEHQVLADRFARADKAMSDTLYFPPEGGQHNQWYQCSDCQMALETVDVHHHKCPDCGKIYSGFPYDNVLYSRQNSRNISSA
ncbi:MAG: hypothetical protein HZB98_12190 [Bacteroidia bacterium]|nr:hypothetical protein [Bacteroidia bacterium]